MLKQQNNRLQKGYIRRYTLTEGKEAGLRVVELDNGILRVLLCESKALDVMQVFYRGENISFVSKNGFTARQLPFINRFEGGMIYTCGLDSIGGREGFELHGTHHNTPARVVSVCEGCDALTVVAHIEETALFGKNLLMERRVTLPMDGGALTVEDTLYNRGTAAEPYCLLYHINLGYPLLDAGAQIDIDAEQVIPRSAHSAASEAGRTLFPAPIDNEEESCYYIKNRGNTASVYNKAKGLRFTLSYSKETLPALVQWVSPASHDYALGLEPATSFLDDYFTYQTVGAGESVSFSLTLALTEEK